MNFRLNKSWWLLGVGLVLGAGVAHAANQAYDEAKANIVKASAHLSAITPAANEKPGEASQRKRAIRALERAKIRIACAQAIADGGKPGCPAAHDRFDDNDDDDEHDHDHHKGHQKDDDKKKKREEAEKQQQKKREEAEKQQQKKREEAEKQRKEAAEKQKKK